MGVVSACAAAACVPDQGPPYAGANALQGVAPPLPPTAPSNCDGGAAPNASCSVSFRTKLMPMFAATGPGRCGSGSCHGSDIPPVMSNDAAKTYAELAAKTVRIGTANVPYVDVCSNKAESSAILCNLAPASAAGACGYHMPTSAPDLAASDLEAIKTWIECGAPNN